MSEQGDWHFVEEDIGPALENKTSYSTLSDDSDENLQFMEASLTESFLQSKNEEIQLPLPIAKMDCIQEITAAGAVEDERIRTEERSDVLIPSSQGENKYEGRKIQPATTTRTSVMVAPAATSIIVILLAGSVLASSLMYAKFKFIGNEYAIKPSPSSAIFRRRPSPPSCSVSKSFSSTRATDFQRSTSSARLPESSTEDTEINNEINSRLDMLEIEVLSASHRLTHHDLRLTSLESKVNELTEMMLKISSYDDKCTPEFQAEPVAEKIIAGSGGSEKTAKFLENNNDAEDDATIKDTTKLDIDKLRDRIAALEHGMDAIHLLLSSSSDGVDQELATLSATIWRLQEKVEELEGIW
ncbi:hypothetical protein Ndes2437B_g00891 [Nannochloris sp. 'desiccata']